MGQGCSPRHHGRGGVVSSTHTAGRGWARKCKRGADSTQGPAAPRAQRELVGPRRPRRPGPLPYQPRGDGATSMWGDVALSLPRGGEGLELMDRLGGPREPLRLTDC